MDQNSSQTGSAGATLGEQTKQQTQQVTDKGKQIAGQAIGKARDQVKGQLSGQIDTLSTTLEGVAQALLLTSSHLRDQGQNQISKYGDQAAEQVTKVSTYLKQRDLDAMIRETGDLARRRPALVLGTALTLGVLAARFLKSSSQTSDQNSTSPNGNGSQALVPYVETDDRPQDYTAISRPDTLPDGTPVEDDYSGVRPRDGV